MTPSLSGRIADDVAGRAADHPLRLDADGEDAAGVLVDGHDAGLVQHDAAAADVDERVGGAEVDGHVTTDERQCCSWGRRLPTSLAGGVAWAGQDGSCTGRPPVQSGPDLDPLAADPTGAHELRTRRGTRRHARRAGGMGEQIPISRAADSGESEPWTRFCWTVGPQSRPRSPRIVPGRGRGRVGRAGEGAETLDAALALDHHRDHRAGGHELDERLVERLALVLGVVLGEQVAARPCAGRAPPACSPWPRSGAAPRRSGRGATPSGLTRTRLRSVRCRSRQGLLTGVGDGRGPRTSP